VASARNCREPCAVLPRSGNTDLPLVVRGRADVRAPSFRLREHQPMETFLQTCTRCARPVRVSADQFEVFERMHYVCFHYEYEHDPFDPDEECNAGGCPSAHLDSSPRQLRE
jgi:hypothetical protein